MNTNEIIDKIFKDPKTKYELTEFDNLGKPLHQILNIYPKIADSGRDAGKTKYFMKSFVPFTSGKEEIQVFDETGKSNPEEIVRQLWVYKLINHYEYRIDEIELEKSVYFGTEVNTKAADIVVYTDSTKQTPKIIIEVKKPKRKDGIEQLKSYLNAQGSPVGVWSNGSELIILFRPYPANFDDTLVDIPKRGQEPKDVLEIRKSLSQLKKNFNFKKIIQDLEELVLADSGKDEFNEIFKIIFAKIWDEKEALESRKNQEVYFGKALDPEVTYERINSLFKKACEEWPGIFKEGEDIELTKKHLQICIGPIESIRLMGSNLRIMDDAFEYLLPTEAKKKKGQFFTPRHIIEMCVRMLNPHKKEFVLDPSCGSAGFLLHTMEWAYPANDLDSRELRKHKFAAKYLWGIDFEERAAKTSRALMLIAGDGHTNIFGPDVNSLDPKTWYETKSGQNLMNKLLESKLIKNKPNREDEPNILKDDDLAWKYFDELLFDVVLANPPFAGEIKDKKMLAHYDLGKPALKRAKDKGAKEERDVLFIERILKFLKPGGRAAIVLPQGKFNNSSLAFIREWILRKARLLAVVGLHPNSFKPHTGTKTSVLFVQKYTDEQIADIEKIKQEVAAACPEYESQIKDLLASYSNEIDVPEDSIPEAIAALLLEAFGEVESETLDTSEESESDDNNETVDLTDLIAQAEENVSALRKELLKEKENLENLSSDIEALEMIAKQEMDVITNNWHGTKNELKAELKFLKDKLKSDKQVLKEGKKEQTKKIKANIKSLEKAIPNAEFELKKLTNKGKLELLLTDSDLLGTLKERWINAEVAKKLDYPIFMAVSERGGKNNSGDYEYLTDEDGNLIEYDDGQPVIDQDLVNFDLGRDELVDAALLPESQMCIAEAFVKFAQKHNFDFWREE
ncbi:TPA: N-6 DNA methylase [Legionella pneumophila]|nr:N-6 DNA methylase [Legionella pneumophila]HAT2066833.1 N-6 DNA methylase [Legionella pneumophila]HAT8592920.1 N-6 DNA methylase [Legionella pneumophila]HAU1576498.1 N-6 DNA methylase [Legionella pneumophila]HAU1681364.1 N-6 DNA methylase [Legionella pneumophila]HAU3699698.1 N-6 DNA methylase [Legionella pneumophila]